MHAGRDNPHAAIPASRYGIEGGACNNFHIAIEFTPLYSCLCCHRSIPIPPMETPFRADVRRASRVKLAASIQILSSSTASMEGETLDLSENGMGLFSLTRLAPGESCMVALPIPNDRNQRRINSWGKIIYCHALKDGYRMGFEFSDMDARSRDCIRCLALDLLTCGEKCYQVT